MSTDSPAYNEAQIKARGELVSLCRAMLANELSFFEGAIRENSLRSTVGTPDHDPDLMAFVTIASETDHLPPLHSQHLWSASALQRLQPEFEKTEIWAKTFAPQACKNLIERFARK